MRIGRNPSVTHTGSIRRFATPAVATLIALLAFAFQTGSTSAAEFRTGDSPKVAANETVTGDLYLFGGDVDIDGTVRGDVVASSGRFTLTGVIDGSLTVAAGDINIDGSIDRSLRVAGGDVTITGEIGGDIVVAGGSVTIADTATISGDLIVGGGDVDVLGPIDGDIRGNVDTITVNATIGGDIKLDADNIRLRSRARVAGDLDYTSRNEAKLDDGARVTGTTRQTEPARFYPGDNVGAWFASAIFRLLCALFAGVVLVLLLPRAVATVADGIRVAPASSFVLGLVLFFLVPILVVILLVTIVGIPIALILLVAYFCTLYLSQVFLGLALGRIILPKSWDTSGRGYNLLAMALGVVVLGGLRLIPLPFVSAFIASITAIFGLGAIILGPRRLRAQTAAAVRPPDWQWNRPE